MGNAISNDEYDEMAQLLDEIFNHNDYPILDIGNRQGTTGYIDFIKPSELMNHSIMKGIDNTNRRFLVFKSETLVNRKNVKMFTTFFQRYSNHPTLYHTAGNYTKYLFDTAGGCKLIQLKYLRDLLKNREIQLKYEDVEKLNITYRSLYNYSDEDKSAVNDTIRIGDSAFQNRENVEKLNDMYRTLYNYSDDASASASAIQTVDGEISIIENNEYSTDDEGEYLFKEKSIYLNPGDCIDFEGDCIDSEHCKIM
jgi:hypothetical protein